MATSEHTQQNIRNTLTLSFPELLHFVSTACYQRVALTLICASSFSGNQTNRSLSSTIYITLRLWGIDKGFVTAFAKQIKPRYSLDIPSR